MAQDGLGRGNVASRLKAGTLSVKRKGPRTAALILEPGVFFYMLGLGGGVPQPGRAQVYARWSAA